MSRLLLCTMMALLLTGCGLKRNLELPGQEKYRHNCPDDNGNKIDPTCKDKPAVPKAAASQDSSQPGQNGTAGSGSPPPSLSNPAIVPPMQQQ